MNNPRIITHRGAALGAAACVSFFASAAIALGKAFFWDMQAGSDGQACASCHFAAGADNRINNQLSPGLLDVNNPDSIFDYTNTGKRGPNYVMTTEDFPLRRLADPDDRDSSVLHDMNDTVSSQGTFGGGLVSIPRAPIQQNDNCETPAPSVFSVRDEYGKDIAVRKVEPRNTPSTLNAVFFHRNFLDGRASNIFNGLNPLGERGLLPTEADPAPGILVLQPDGSVANVQVRLDNASLASQAVGPPLSDLKASCAAVHPLPSRKCTRMTACWAPGKQKDEVIALHWACRSLMASWWNGPFTTDIGPPPAGLPPMGSPSRPMPTTMVTPRKR